MSGDGQCGIIRTFAAVLIKDNKYQLLKPFYYD